MAVGGRPLPDRLVAATAAVGERLLSPIERLLGSRSLLGDRPFFDPRDLPWTARLEEGWQAIRAELDLLLERLEELPNFQEISSDQRSLTEDNRWKTAFIYGYGYRSPLLARLCPRTTALVESVPGMVTAMFSILAPGKEIPPHRGPYKGLLRYHLGLIVPQEAERCWIRVDNQIRYWREGESLLFDDTFEHEVANETDQLRAVLFLDVLRPLPPAEGLFNRAVVKGIALSPFIREALRNQRAWERQFEGALGRKAAA